MPAWCDPPAGHPAPGPARPRECAPVPPRWPMTQRRLRRRGADESTGLLASQPRPQQLLALLGALAALRLGLAKEFGQFGVALAFGVLDVGLQPQGVAQAGLGEPDDVVVLILGAGDLPGLATAGHLRLLERLRLWFLYP